jgi:hypothetical protein
MDDGMNIFVVLLIIVFAVFQLILFFKIWGMTNDVKEIKNKIPNNDRIRDAELAYITGNPEIAKKILDDYLEKTIKEEKEDRYTNEPKFRKEKILSTYRYLGLSIPEEK